MAEITILSIVKRAVEVRVKWDDGLTGHFTIPNVPVESFADSHAMMSTYISSQYDAAVRERDRIAYENPIPDPLVLQAINRTFDNDGNLIR